MRRQRRPQACDICGEQYALIAYLSLDKNPRRLERVPTAVRAGGAKPWGALLRGEYPGKIFEPLRAASLSLEREASLERGQKKGKKIKNLEIRR